MWDIPNVAKNDTSYVTTGVQWDIPYGRFSVSQNCIPPYRVIVDILYLSFANPTENVVLGLRFLDFLVKAHKKMIFFVFMISTLKSLEIDSPFEIIEFRDVFCGCFLFEMTFIRIAKSPFHMIRKMISFRNVTEGEKSSIISKRNYLLYFKTRGHHHIEERGTHHIKRTVAHHFKMMT